jgi:hypothetical protein
MFAMVDLGTIVQLLMRLRKVRNLRSSLLRDDQQAVAWLNKSAHLGELTGE